MKNCAGKDQKETVNAGNNSKASGVNAKGSFNISPSKHSTTTNTKYSTMKDYLVQAKKIGVSEILEEMIQRAQEQQDSQTTLIISTHRGRKGRRGGIEFKVQKVRRNQLFGDEVTIGNAYWQPESCLSQSKITEYWESQMNPVMPAKVPKKQQNNNSSPAELIDRFEEGNHCFVQRETRPGSGESCDKRQIQSERTYPELNDIEISHCFNYGNWKHLKSKSNKSAKGISVTVWKCQDCGYKLQKNHLADTSEQQCFFVTKDHNENEVLQAHNWSDRKHALTKPKRKKNDTPLHTSIQAIFAYYEKTGKVPQVSLKRADLPLVIPRQFTARELIMMLKKEFPRLSSEFGPTEAQVMHFQRSQKETLSTTPPKKNIAQSRLGFGFLSDQGDSNQDSSAERQQKNTEIFVELDLNAIDGEDNSKNRSSGEKESYGQEQNSNQQLSERDELDNAVEELLDISMPRNSQGADSQDAFDAKENIQPMVQKSIMKKPSTPIPFSLFGKRARNTQSLEELINECNKEVSSNGKDALCNSDEELDQQNSLKVIGATSANMAQKRVKFNQKHDKVFEFEVQSEEEDSEQNKKEKEAEQDSFSMDSAEFSEDICGSDNEDMEKGLFFDYIERERKRQEAERKYIVYKLRSKQRVGSIFIDKVKRVIAAIQREQGKYDYLIEWEYHPRDKLKPTTSIVKGSHFVFAKPLLFRRYIEESYLSSKSMGEQSTSQPVICQSPSTKGTTLLSQ